MLTLCTLLYLHRDDRRRHGHLHVHQDAGRGRLHHRDPDHPADHPVRRACLQPVSTLEGSARVIGSIWPTTYYMHSSLGAYTKGLAAAPHDARPRRPGAAAIPILLAHQHVRPQEAGQVAMRSLAQHPVARAQGAPQLRSATRCWSCSSSTRSPGPSTRRRPAPRTRSTTPRSRSPTRTTPPLSKELFNAFYPPRFQRPVLIPTERGGRRDGPGAVHVRGHRSRPGSSRTCAPGRHPDIQVSIDATAMQQAGIGAGYIKNIINQRIATFMQRTDVGVARRR